MGTKNPSIKKEVVALPREDVRLELRIKNNLLYTAIFSKFKSVSEFCRAAKSQNYKIAEFEVGRLLNLKCSPFQKKHSGELRQVCYVIEAMLKISAEKLFPPRLYKKLGANREVLTFHSSRRNVPAIADMRVHLLAADEPSPVELATQHELRERLELILMELPYKERTILKLRLGLELDGYSYTLEQIGRIFKISPESVRQLEVKAIQKMQIPSRARTLLDFLPLDAKTNWTEANPAQIPEPQDPT